MLRIQPILISTDTALLQLFCLLLAAITVVIIMAAWVVNQSHIRHNHTRHEE